MRTALYARYSSDQQNPRSIGDQFAVLERHAAARGWTVVARFEDAAISGSAMANRPGLLSLLKVAESGAGVFDRVLAEHEDRVSRDLADLAAVAKRLRYAGAPLATLAADQVSTMHVAFNGAMAEQYLANLSQKTSRGMRANAEAGLATGGRLYGYRSAAGGVMEIVEDQAAVVRRIFADYAAGMTGREIAHRLNGEGVPAARGGAWTGVQITGSRARANGLLRTDLYRGVKVWNRLEVRKDPMTGKRSPTVRPIDQWRSTPVPALRIVDQPLWDAVQARLDAAGGDGAASDRARAGAQARRRRGLFSGLLRCGVCGAGYTVYTGERLMCAAHREKGDAVCANHRTIKRPVLEARILEGLRTRMLSPAATAAYVRAYHRAWAAEEAARRISRGPAEQRLAQLDRKIARLVDAVTDGTDSPAIRQRLAEHEADRAGAAAELAALDAAGGDGASLPVTLHPRLPEIYAARVAQLQARLSEIDKRTAGPAELNLIDAVRDLVISITLTPPADTKAPIEVTLNGQLALFLTPAADAGADTAGSQRKKGGAPPGTPPLAPRRGGYPLVAGGGIEPPTCGL